MNARLMIASAAAVASLGVAAASHAEDVRLAYGDLDLSQPAQAKVLDVRIDRAAQNWCADNVPPGTRMEPEGCAANVRAQLIAGLPAAARSAYMAAHQSSASTANAAPRSGM